MFMKATRLLGITCFIVLCVSLVGIGCEKNNPPVDTGKQQPEAAIVPPPKVDSQTPKPEAEIEQSSKIDFGMPQQWKDWLTNYKDAHKDVVNNSKKWEGYMTEAESFEWLRANGYSVTKDGKDGKFRIRREMVILPDGSIIAPVDWNFGVGSTITMPGQGFNLQIADGRLGIKLKE